MMTERRPPSRPPAPPVSTADPAVTVAWLAEHWAVSEQTIRRDIAKGALRAYRLPSGALRVRMSDAIRYGRPLISE